MSPNDIIYQKPFQAAVKLVVKNRPIPVRQVNANFVPKREFKKARFTVNEDYGWLWLKERNKSLNGHEDPSLDLITAPLDEDEVNDTQSQGEKKEKLDSDDFETQWNYHQEQPVSVKYKIDQSSTDRLRSYRRTIPAKVINVNHTEVPTIIDQREDNNTEVTTRSLSNIEEDSEITAVKIYENENPISTSIAEEKYDIPYDIPSVVDSQSGDDFLDEIFGKEVNSEVTATSELSVDQEQMFEELKKHVSDITLETENAFPSPKGELDLDEFLNDYKE